MNRRSRGGRERGLFEYQLTLHAERHGTRPRAVRDSVTLLQRLGCAAVHYPAVSLSAHEAWIAQGGRAPQSHCEEWIALKRALMALSEGSLTTAAVLEHARDHSTSTKLALYAIEECEPYTEAELVDLWRELESSLSSVQPHGSAL